MLELGAYSEGFIEVIINTNEQKQVTSQVILE